MRVVVLIMTARGGGRVIMVVHVIADGATSKLLNFLVGLRLPVAIDLDVRRDGSWIIF